MYYLHHLKIFTFAAWVLVGVLSGATSVLAAPSTAPMLSDIAITPGSNGNYTLTGSIKNPDWNSTSWLYPFVEYAVEAKPGVRMAEQYVYPLGVGLILSRDEVKPLPFSFTPPSFLTGDVKVSFGINDAVGNLVAKTPLSSLTLPSPRYFSLGSCTYNGAEIDSPTNPFTVSAGEIVEVECFVNNGTASERELSLLLNAYVYGVHGKKISEIRTSMPVKAASGEPFKLKLPQELLSINGNHALELYLTDETAAPLSRPFFFRIDVPGAASEITLLRLDRDKYSAGDTATVGYRSDVRPPVDVQVRTFGITASIADSNGVACTGVMERIPYAPTDEDIQELKLPIIADCMNPVLTLNILDNNNNVILSENVSTGTEVPGVGMPVGGESATAATKWILWVVASIILVGAAIGGFFWWKKRGSSSTPPPAFPSTM